MAPIWSTYQQFLHAQFCVSVGSPGAPGGSPLLVDLSQNEFHLSADGIGVEFDINNSGEETLIQWVAQGTDDAFLAFDFNYNGVVDDGAELFGTASPMMLAESPAENGFAALAQYDTRSLGGNEDGQITEDDWIWGMLSLWVDVNANGATDPGELTYVHDSSLKSIPTMPKENNRHDPAGNWIPFWN